MIAHDRTSPSTPEPDRTTETLLGALLEAPPEPTETLRPARLIGGGAPAPRRRQGTTFDVLLLYGVWVFGAAALAVLSFWLIDGPIRDWRYYSTNQQARPAGVPVLSAQRWAPPQATPTLGIAWGAAQPAPVVSQPADTRASAAPTGVPPAVAPAPPEPAGQVALAFDTEPPAAASADAAAGALPPALLPVQGIIPPPVPTEAPAPAPVEAPPLPTEVPAPAPDPGAALPPAPNDLLLPLPPITGDPPAPAAAAPPASLSPTWLQIPRIGVDTPVVDTYFTSDTWETADYAASYLVGSGIAGEIGNVVLSGHAGVRGAVFRDIGALQPGDEIIIYRPGWQFVYHVRERQVVWPDQLDVIHWRPEAVLTLMTCTNWDTQRILVVADLVGGWPVSP